jgi:hypothetical protein
MDAGAGAGRRVQHLLNALGDSTKAHERMPAPRLAQGGIETYRNEGQ